METIWNGHAFETVQQHGHPPLEASLHHRSLLNLTQIPKYDNASVFHQTEWVDVNTISITLMANVALFLLSLIYFWSSRRHHPGYFSSKRHFLPDQTPDDLPTSGFFRWMFALMAKPEEEVLSCAGFDAAIFLRFYNLSFKIFALFAPYGLLVLIPINMREAPGDKGDFQQHASNINTFNRLSMSNIQHYDARMWYHAFGVYLLSGLAMYFLLIEYRYYTSLRHTFLKRKSAHQRTIVVEGVPKEMRSDSKLFTYFNTLYPEEVVNVHIPQDLSHLRKLLKQRASILDSLGKGLAEKGVRGEEQYHYTGWWCCKRQRVNTVGYCSRELDRLNLAVANEQDRRIPSRRGRYGWGPALPSISSIDMSYELGAKPEAGPIERVVVLENIADYMETSGSDGSDARSNGQETGSDVASGAASAANGGNSDGAGAGDSSPNGSAADEKGLTRKVPESGVEGPSAASAAAVATDAVMGMMDNKTSAMEAGEGEPLMDGVTGDESGGGISLTRAVPGAADAGRARAAIERERQEAHRKRGAERDGAAALRTVQQQQEEYWGKGQRTARGGSPRGVGTAGWGSPSGSAYTAPRLSVDLINVDPVKEAVKSTVSTLYKVKGKLGYGSLAGGGSDNKGAHSTAPNGNGNYVSFSPAARAATSGGKRREGGLSRPPSGRWDSESMSLLWRTSSGGNDNPNQTHPHHHPNRRSTSKKMYKRYSSRAFVTFRSFAAATVARQVLHCARPGRMAASSAPEPRDVYWPNAIVTRRQHTVKRLCVEILLAFLMLLFPLIVTLLSFSFSAENIIQHSAIIKDFCGRSSLFQSMIELIQPMCVIAVMGVLPVMLRWVGHFEGILAESWIQMQTLSRYFAFQVLNVFLVTTVAGFAVEILTRQLQAQIVRKLVDHPSLLFTLLGETLPKVCGFFCDYVIIRAFTGMAMELVRGYALLPALLDLVMCKKKWGRSPYGTSTEDRQRFGSNTSSRSSHGEGENTASGGQAWTSSGRVAGSASPPMRQNDLRRPDNPGCFYYGQIYAQDLLVVVVVMTYACVAPVVLIPALMFFGMAQVVYRHQLLYVYVPKFESGGSFFPKMFRRWIFAMFTAQATMVGMCLLKQGFKQAYSIMFLMVLTYAFKRKTRSTYEPVSFSLPLEIARGLDLDRVESGPMGVQEDEALQPATNQYLQPELREPAFVGPDDRLRPDETFG